MPGSTAARSAFSTKEAARACSRRRLSAASATDRFSMPTEITDFVRGITDGSVSEGQIGAFTMAVYLNGMTAPERVALSLAMRDSGRVLDWSGSGIDETSSHREAFVGRRRRREDHVARRAACRGLRCFCSEPVRLGSRLLRRRDRHARQHPRLRYRAVIGDLHGGGQGGRRRDHRSDSRSRARRPQDLQGPRRHRDGREHRADHRLDHVEEARRGSARTGRHRRLRLGRLYGDAGGCQRAGGKHVGGRRRRGTTKRHAADRSQRLCRNRHRRRDRGDRNRRFPHRPPSRCPRQRTDADGRSRDDRPRRSGDRYRRRRGRWRPRGSKMAAPPGISA